MNPAPPPLPLLPVAAVHRCERCNLPIDGPRYSLRVEATPPEPRGMELSLCESCLASLGRWLDRKHRQSEPGGSARAGGGPGGRRPGGWRGASRRSPYADALDRGVTAIRAQMYLAVAAIVLTACGLIGLVIYLLVRA